MFHWPPHKYPDLKVLVKQSSRESRPLLGSLSSLDLRTLSLSCLLLLLSGDQVTDLLLDLGDLLDLEDLLHEDTLPLGLPVRLPDGLEAAHSLGEADRLLYDLAGAGRFLVEVLLFPSG